MNILIVRLGALGDVVHTIPAVAALRAARPEARIDWLVEARHRAMVDLVDGLDRVVAIEGRSIAGWAAALRQVRQVTYDAALDFQGLMKSAVLARASGARRVAGFSIWHLREKSARAFYSDTSAASSDDDAGHVIRKNLSLLEVIGVSSDRIEFPLRPAASPALERVRQARGDAAFALINPGAAWPNKRWPAERYGELAAVLRDVRGLDSLVLWGPGEEALAAAVVDASAGAAAMAPATNVADLVALARAASLIVSGDTGPLHIAAAVGTPAVSLYGPTNPSRNGPWSEADRILSRFESCSCHYKRACEAQSWCLGGVTVAEVTAAVQQRLAMSGPRTGGPT
jgi:heptosyltransferase I